MILTGHFQWKGIALALLLLAAGMAFIPTGSASPAPDVNLVIIPSHPYGSLESGLALYSPGEPVALNLTLQNSGPGPVTVLGIPPRTGVSHTGWQDFRTWQRNMTAILLPDGRSVSATFSWDQRDGNGTPVSPGIYTIGTYFLYAAGDTGGAWDLSGAHQLTGTTQILVTHPGGSLVRLVPLSVTEKDSGVTATLISLDIGAMRGIASLDVEIPEKSRDITPRPEGIVPCDVSAYPSADYRIDHGSMQKFLDMDFICDTTPAQVHRVHLYFEPLPANARTMDIYMHSFGKVNGSWNFTVDLTAGSPARTGTDHPVTQAPVPWGTALLAAGSVAAGLRWKKTG